MQGKTLFTLLSALTLALLLLLTKYAVNTPMPASENAGFAAADFLRGVSDSDFAIVDGQHDFQFPADHGPHPQYRSEWWYFTGNLEDERQRRFGYQLTFFRFNPSARQDEHQSNWRSNQLFMAHFTITDKQNGKFHAFERFSRASAGLAGAEPGRFNVWLDDWSAHSPDEAEFPFQIHASEANVSLQLELQEGKTRVLHGENGVSTKNSEPGNASYYYSYTRMPSTGRIVIDDENFTVAGESWMDREWSSSALGKDQRGWDWFALQLDNDHELMFYRLRREDDRPDEYSYGALILPTGKLVTLGYKEINLKVLNKWKSGVSATEYPATWHLQIPGQHLSLVIEPIIANQELNLSFRYWEGAVNVSGKHDGKNIKGHGYVELTGY